jgi:hypothetical protein
MRRAAVALARRVHLITCEESAQQWCEKYLEASVAGQGSQRGIRSHGETIWETQVITVVKVVWKGMVMRGSIIVQKQSRMARFDKTQGMAV